MEITEESSSSGKRKANPLNYKRNVIKKSRVPRKPYTNYKGDSIPSKVMPPPPLRSCNAKCFEKLPGKEFDENYERFYSLDNKDSQDMFLQGLINIRDIQRRRARVQIGNKPKAYASVYHVYKRSVKEKVCLSAFTLVYGITPGRVRRVRDLGALGKSPKDKRGKNPSINKLR
ncbi:hypothetical protein MML48_9g00005383 [Holotrichia oblita]|uniref:Uncharacterized protein n=1 Tax=Holotrichia oblita TaxID=644536 RepID=A0ACB9SLB6_HOLOL|nr:hypothetical protein MML48_9g00005383 [Holotrichia oblita]